MTTEQFIIETLAGANPIPGDEPVPLDRDPEAQRILRRVLAAPPRPRRRRRIALVAVPILSALVVLAVVAAVVRIGGSGGGTASSVAPPTRLVFRAQPTPQTPRVNARVMARTVAVVRARVRGVDGRIAVRRSGSDLLVVTFPASRVGDRAAIVRLVTQPGGLITFYDWEANVLAPDGKTVASQLQAQVPAALKISQGAASGPGAPLAGSLSLYAAVRLAAHQTTAPPSGQLSRLGPQYYLFGAPGSAACAQAALTDGAPPAPGVHCLLSGPGDSVAEADAGLPSGVSRAQAELVKVPQGTVVLMASSPRLGQQVGFADPSAQFFVLRDDVAISSAQITNPQAGRDASGSPDVVFQFTAAGERAFERVTAQIARRGQHVSLGGETLPQHFAIALDSQLATVPSIDFRQYPDGIQGGDSADISGGLTAGSARMLAAQLRAGVMPVQLRLLG
ncbi:MAG TPA: hypothetical protein VHX62_08840 [Solirubrobacteraceae bacterium]|jgi:hypothetical protein|nr:hypothetical protein [Solirubrobacteraceae bacterium]